MSSRTRCRACGWHPAYRSQLAGRRAARAHVCHPRYARRTVR
ncbi:hypothetical protein [Streptomyces cylindrosporus]|nr:hypothetical protein [Streptomyces cylindrosporus]